MSGNYIHDNPIIPGLQSLVLSRDTGWMPKRQTQPTDPGHVHTGLHAHRHMAEEETSHINSLDMAGGWVSLRRWMLLGDWTSGSSFPILGFAGDSCVKIGDQLRGNLHRFWGLSLGCQACGAKCLYPLTIESWVLYVLGRCSASELHLCTSSDKSSSFWRRLRELYQVYIL